MSVTVTLLVTRPYGSPTSSKWATIAEEPQLVRVRGALVSLTAPADTAPKLAFKLGNTTGVLRLCPAHKKYGVDNKSLDHMAHSYPVLTLAGVIKRIYFKNPLKFELYNVLCCLFEASKHNVAS